MALWSGVRGTRIDDPGNRGVQIPRENRKVGVRNRVSLSKSSQILRFDWASQAYQPFVTPGSGGIADPYGVTFGADGNLYATALRGSLQNLNRLSVRLVAGAAA